VRSSAFRLITRKLHNRSSKLVMRVRFPFARSSAPPQDVRSITERRNRGGSLDWATNWLRMTPQRLFSFAELAWQGMSTR
jgi:hypothetical protein